MGIWILDNANLEEVAVACRERNRWEFMISIGPLRLHNTTGSPDDNKIGIYTMDGDSGALSHKADAAMPGGPSLLAISPDKGTLYVSHRESLGLSSHRIDPASGGLTQTGSVAVEDWPAYIATDRTGRHLTVAFYGGARAGVYPIGADGELGGAPSESVETVAGAHSILTDRSNRFAYVPHIAYIQDNVLEPPKNIPGPT
ncbi:6-phosphogluconolactonase [Geodia barretti]|uniref:6-phosphogluconolactonase n=1 Tax=Geodia barretti TaxID=519541 RepID=A0AA35TAK8_GEOBA|nr:6-phosphogluconolactonase [Geodia barretti]